jgi:hypothetical protein
MLSAMAEPQIKVFAIKIQLVDELAASNQEK